MNVLKNYMEKFWSGSCFPLTDIQDDNIVTVFGQNWYILDQSSERMRPFIFDFDNQMSLV